MSDPSIIGGTMPPSVLAANRREAVTTDTVTRFNEDRRLETYWGSKQGPHGFLVTVPPRGRVGTHFHLVDQFQVVFGGTGVHYKNMEIPSGQCVVHYVDSSVAYGPIIAGSGTVEFFTLRADYNQVTLYMPEDRRQRQKTARHRNLSSQISIEDCCSTGAPLTLFEDQSDSLFARRILSHDAEITLAHPAPGSQGAYLCVLTGSATLLGSSYEELALIWLEPGVGSVLVTRPPNSPNLNLLHLQFGGKRSL